MNDLLFAELVQSTGEGGSILRGEIEPSRVIVVESEREGSTGKAPPAPPSPPKD